MQFGLTPDISEMFTKVPPAIFQFPANVIMRLALFATQVKEVPTLLVIPGVPHVGKIASEFVVYQLIAIAQGDVRAC